MKRCDYCGGDATSDNVSAHDNISVLHYSKIDCASVLKAEVERLRGANSRGDKHAAALTTANPADLNDPNMRWVVALALAFRQAGATHSPIEPDHEAILRCLKGMSTTFTGNMDVLSWLSFWRDKIPAEAVAALRRLIGGGPQGAVELHDRWKAALEKILNIRTEATQLEDVWKEARQIAFDAFGSGHQ